MKNVIRGLVIIFVLLLAAVILLPVIFKDDLVRLVKQEVNENLDARVEFGEFGMSLFRSFPDFSFSIEQVSVVGIGDFEGDTLVSVGKLDLTVDLLSVIFGDEILVKEIAIEDLDVRAKVLRDGRANWDITKKVGVDEVKEPEVAAGPPADSPYAFSLKSLHVSRSNVSYADDQRDIYAGLDGLDFSLRGDFAKGFTTLGTEMAVSAVTLDMGGIKYLNRAELDFHADIDADLTNGEYTLKDNELRLNQLYLGWEGSVSVPESGPELDIRFKAKQTDVKNILSLVPVVYTRDFERVEASGKLALDGHVRGGYQEDMLPEFGVKLTVEEGRFKYPDLPRSAERISVMMNVTNPGGDLDRTMIAVHKFHVEIAGNPLDARLVIKTPVSDPEIHCAVEGKIDLDSIGDVIPLEEGEKISGVITSDIRISGKVSAIEKKEFDKFQAVGGLTVKGMNYTSRDLPRGITIDNAALRFSPQYVDLSTLECRIGRSDISAKGKVENFIPYAMTDDAVLMGRGELKSRFLDLGEFMADETESKAGEAAETSPFSAIEVPANLDLEISSALDRVVYGNMTMDGVKGKLKVKDRVLTMERLEMGLLGGKATVNGSYSTVVPDRPAVALDLNIVKWDIPVAFRAVNTVQRLAPIAESCTGLFSSSLNFNGTFGKDMQPILSSLNGSGNVHTEKTVVQNSKTMNRIADVLKNESFRRLEFRDLTLPFQFKDGRVIVKPFDVRLGKSKANISGSHGFDQTLDYSMKMDIPTSEFGGNFNSFLGSVSSQLSKTGLNVDVAKMAEEVRLELLIRGTVSDPKVSIGSLNLIGNGGQALIDQVAERIKKEAENIMKEAETRATQVRENARKAAEALRKEGYAKADNLESEAKDPVAKAAARVAAEKMRSETDKKANQIIHEADQQAEKILAEARKKVEELGG